MSDLLRSALGIFNNPVGGPGGPQPGSQGDHYGGGGSSGPSDETSAVGDVISFQCDSQKKNVRIQKLVAEGGFSYVYRGVDTASGEIVALKKMIATDSDSLKAIEQEVEFMRQFQHDNIIKFYGSIVRPSGRLKEYFISMEYCPVQLPSPPLRLQHTTQVFGQTCKAIKYLHDFGIVHRDIKLENVLIGLDGLVKLVDFGSATMEKVYPTPDWSMSKRTLVEESIAQKTTPMYRAPEMLDLWSNYPIDERCDMWALGCLLFALNFGQHPFQDSNKLAITNANYNLPKNVSDSNPLVCIIRGLLKVNPTDRMSFGQIYDMLQSIAECEGFSINGKLPFKPAVSPIVNPAGPSPPVGNGAPHVSRPPPPAQSQSQHRSSSHGSGSGGLFSSIKGVGSSLLKNIKESSQQYMYGGPEGAPGGNPPQSVPPPNRPPPPGSHPPAGPPARPAPPSPRQQAKSQHLEFENREYEMMQQQQQRQNLPHRPAPPKPPPPRASPVPHELVQETVGNLLDISLEPPTTQAFTSASEPTQAATNNDLLDDLFGSSSSSTATTVPAPNITPSFADDLLWGNNSSSGTTNQKSEMNLLGETTDPFASLLGKSAPAPSTTTNASSGFQQAGFGGKSGFGMAGAGGPTMMQPGVGMMPQSASFQNLSFPAKNPSQQQQQIPVAGMDLLGPSPAKGSSGMPKNSSTPNLLSDLILGDLMGPTAKMNISGGSSTNGSYNPSSAAAATSVNKSNPTINQFEPGRNGGPQGKIFVDATVTSPTNPAEKKQTLNDAFGDILSSQGFASAKGGQQTKTINDLRKIEMLQNPNIDPVQLKVNEWREGKKKNIRALLASLHTITWEGCNWEETNMSQMITPAQVKKTYRKACLAIHPDKQMGKDWEQLAKLLFVELNEAWAAFEESQQT